MPFLIELGEAVLWFCISAAISAFGVIAALIGMWFSYTRGTRCGRTPIVCAVLAAIIALLLWLIYVAADPPLAMIFAIGMSVATFMTFASWLSRYDRN